MIHANHRYGVLRGLPIERTIGTEETKHYEVHIKADHEDFRIAVNIESDASVGDSTLFYYVDPQFHHPITQALVAFTQNGFHPLDQRADVALDYIRGNLFSPEDMHLLPPSLPGPNNDLNDLLDTYVQRAIADKDAVIYAFGFRWGPESQNADQYFDFLPGNGIHNIHMNQGNASKYAHEDGVWQDGGLILHYPSQQDRWVAIFLKFQSQTWHTDDRTGHALGTRPVDESVRAILPISHEPDLTVRIVGAVLHPTDHQSPQVALLNIQPGPVDLTGWSIVDSNHHQFKLTGHIAATSSLTIPLADSLHFEPSGGTITLLNADGLKVSGVAYTAKQASVKGWMVPF